MVEVKTGDMVLPGDLLATVEEFVPGEGVYEEDGRIYSGVVGTVLIDMRAKKISVFVGQNAPAVLKIGDIVIGRVDEVKEQFASVFLEAMRGKENRALPAPKTGTIHISRVHMGYVRDLGRFFRPGDIVRAKVVGTQREQVQLTTAERDLGVLVALCSRCRNILKREGGKLICSNCGSVESRKIASDYRQG
ncbi:MAG: exosome complex RNA-binding protein Csl4, partial [Candidatus Hadarchaeales archaeon]